MTSLRTQNILLTRPYFTQSLHTYKLLDCKRKPSTLKGNFFPPNHECRHKVSERSTTGHRWCVDVWWLCLGGGGWEGERRYSTKRTSLLAPPGVTGNEWPTGISGRSKKFNPLWSLTALPGGSSSLNLDWLLGTRSAPTRWKRSPTTKQAANIIPARLALCHKTVIVHSRECTICFLVRILCSKASFQNMPIITNKAAQGNLWHLFAMVNTSWNQPFPCSFKVFLPCRESELTETSAGATESAQHYVKIKSKNSSTQVTAQSNTLQKEKKGPCYSTINSPAFFSEALRGIHSSFPQGRKLSHNFHRDNPTNAVTFRRANSVCFSNYYTCGVPLPECHCRCGCQGLKRKLSQHWGPVTMTPGTSSWPRNFEATTTATSQSDNVLSSRNEYRSSFTTGLLNFTPPQNSRCEMVK